MKSKVCQFVVFSSNCQSKLVTRRCHFLCVSLRHYVNTKLYSLSAKVSGTHDVNDLGQLDAGMQICGGTILYELFTFFLSFFREMREIVTLKGTNFLLTYDYRVTRSNFLSG